MASSYNKLRGAPFRFRPFVARCVPLDAPLKGHRKWHTRLGRQAEYAFGELTSLPAGHGSAAFRRRTQEIVPLAMDRADMTHIAVLAGPRR